MDRKIHLDAVMAARSLFDHSADLVCCIDTDKELLYTNQTFVSSSRAFSHRGNRGHDCHPLEICETRCIAEECRTAISGFTHELSNKIGPILGYAELLLREPELTPFLRERIEMVGNSAQSAREILDVSGTASLRPGPLRFPAPRRQRREPPFVDGRARAPTSRAPPGLQRQLGARDQGVAQTHGSGRPAGQAGEPPVPLFEDRLPHRPIAPTILRNLSILPPGRTFCLILGGRRR